MSSNRLIADRVLCKSLISTEIDADTIQGDTVNIDSFTATSITATTFESKTDTISNLHTENLDAAEAIVSQSVNADTFRIDTLTVPQLNFDSAAVGDANTQTSDITDLAAADGTSDSLITSGNLNSQQLVATASSTIEETLTVRAGPNTGGSFYVSPSEGVFRGICFFKDVDVGIGSPTAKISMNMRSSGQVPFLNGYNKYLGAIDSGNDFGGSNAVLSLCTATGTARTLRFQQDGNLAIYSNGTKIWQNGSMVSDARLKENLVPLESPMEKILKLDGVKFDYTIEEGGEKSCGVILEQVREVVPECIVDNLVHIEKLVPLLVEGMKELKRRNALIEAALGRVAH